MKTVIVYGPPASGKTRNAEALRALYKCKGINDEGKATGMFTIKRGYLNLVIKRPSGQPSDVRVIHISDALAELASAVTYE